LLTGINQR